MTWDGTAKAFKEAIGRCRRGDLTHDDVSIIQEVLEAALSARDIRARVEALDEMNARVNALQATARVRTQNEIDALEAEVKRLAARLKEHGL